MWPLRIALTLAAIWLPTLWWGFSSDDFEMVPTTWAQFIANPLGPNARPVDTLLFALLPAHAFTQHALNLGLYAGCIWLAWRVCRRLALDGWSAFLALSAFFHPAFLWSVTWVNQRNTLLLVLLLLGTVASTRTPLKLALIGCASGLKAPYIFQNAVFAAQFARRRQWIAAAIALLCTIVFVVIGYVLYYDPAEDTLGRADIPLTVSAPLRAAKLLEGVVFVFAPIPMFAATEWGPLVAFGCYALLWLVVTQSLDPARLTSTTAWLAALALAMCLPFVLVTEVRLTAEAAVLAFLALASAARWRRTGRIAVAGILTLNLIGIGLNYNSFYSKQYDIQGARVSKDVSQPAFVYQAWRERLRQRVLAAMGVDAPLRQLHE